jgi:hypothetical protein
MAEMALHLVFLVPVLLTQALVAVAVAQLEVLAVLAVAVKAALLRVVLALQQELQIPAVVVAVDITRQQEQAAPVSS